jgi:serine/threonine protein kinase
MDIKGSNIFIDNSGRWSLGDFGSCCRIDELVTSSTTIFCLENVIGLKGKPDFDWFMLLVALVIETLPDKHQFHSVLYEKHSHFISVAKLKQLLFATGNSNLRRLFDEIIGKMPLYKDFFDDHTPVGKKEV